MSRVAAAPNTMNAGFPVDPMISAIAAFLLLYGLIMVGSASMEVRAKTYDDPFYLLTRHII